MEELMKRLIGRGGAFLAVAATALTLGTATALAAPTEIRFTLGEYSANTKTSFERIAEAFEKENPDIDIIIEVIPWANYLQALTTDISGNNAPDMSVVASIWLTEFTQSGLVTPIEDVISADLKDKFIPAMLQPSRIDGELMGLPIAASARAMMINTDLYSIAGVDAPETWEQLEKASQEISSLPGTFGFGLPGKEEEVDVYFYYALWSFGGQIFDENGRSAIASPEGVAAARLYAKLVDEGATQPSPTAYSREDVFNMFKQGKIGTVFTFPMLVPQIKDESPELNYAVLPFPVKAQKSTMAITDSVMVFETSDAKEEIQKFMDFIFEHNFRLEFNKADGLLPVTSSVVADPFYQEDKDMKAFADGLAYAQFQPNVERWDEIIDITRTALQRIYLGEQTPEDALTAAAKQIDELRGLGS
jgi:multiple sugar transport system substrate-binding protein